METTATQELTIIEKSLEILQGGGVILSANKTSVLNASAASQKLLDKIKSNGGKLTAELDKEVMEHLVKINKTLKTMNERRAPYTQTMALIAKEFTGLENQIDPKVTSTPANSLQGLRNQYARDLADEKKKREDEARDAAAKRQEVIDIKAEAENRLNKYFFNYLSIEKAKISESFNAITLETYEGNKASLMSPVMPYAFSHFALFKHSFYATRLHTIDEINAFLKAHLDGKYTELATTYKNEMLQLQSYLIERLPSKKYELEQIAAADATNKQLLLDQQKKREEEQRQQLEDEQKKKLQEAEQQTANAALSDTTMNLFHQETAMQVSQAAPEARTGYEIEVTNTAGWMLIFQFWFTNEGKTLSVEDAGKKSLNQMKAFCEKYAHKNSSKIDSPFIKYNETHKAVNRKEK